jgi:hypothetical protein
MNAKLDGYQNIWCFDFEFRADPGERPVPVCLVARELRSGRLVRQWLTELNEPKPPFDIGPDSIFIAWYATAELTCCLALGWEMPSNVLDLYVEFRNLTNGTGQNCSLVNALSFFGLPSIDLATKEAMRQLAMRPGDHTSEERLALLEYCQTDVDALQLLMEQMVGRIDLRLALVRGRYMRAAAQMEYRGIPIDGETFQRLKQRWNGIQQLLVAKADPGGEVYEGQSFKNQRWTAYLQRHQIPWPKYPSGSLRLDEDTFRQIAKTYPKEVGKWRDIRHTLGQMRLTDLAVGEDNRNRCLLSPFQSKTGRNQPSNAKFVFGPSTWLRSLIKPEQGMSLVYIDWSQQEFGIAAALSCDENMQNAYVSGDPYLTFAKQAGAVPADATKQSHKRERELFKQCCLAVQYGMGDEGLALTLDEPIDIARDLIRRHQKTYPKFWSWSGGAVDQAMLNLSLHTVFGWYLRPGPNPKWRSLANFPCQANGAEMLRLACCLMTERGVGLCAPVHDAVLIEAPTESIEEAVTSAQAAMREASAVVLDGFELKSDFTIVSYPDRYSDERGQAMWKLVTEILDELDPVRFGDSPEPIGRGVGTSTAGASL